VVQVLLDRPDAKLHQVGVYYDKFRRVGDRLKLAERPSPGSLRSPSSPLRGEDVPVAPPYISRP
ncbi:MAG TPA: hypothetical protein VII40_13025, partial [Xanthobacteraceae bacterium]